MSRMSINMVIPCFNEALGIGELLDELLACTVDGRIIIVDDSSADGTAAIARSRGDRVRVLSRPARGGLASAIHAGLKVADSDAVVVMDADGSHEPCDVVRLVSALVDADFAVGSRWVAGGRAPGLNLRRAAWSRFSNSAVNALLRHHVHDWTAGFLALRGSAIPRLTAQPPIARGWTGSLELKYRALEAGMRLVEVPVSFGPRRHGVSKLRSKDVIEALADLFAIRRNRRTTSGTVDGA